jgi:hypothetical protein
MSASDHGTPFVENSIEPVDDWSRAVFEACRDWPLAGAGRWFRVAEGWLRLRIEAIDGAPLEPLFAIDVDTVDGQILLDFGSWGTPIHPKHGQSAEDAAEAVAAARALVEGWLRGTVMLVDYSDESGWRGSKIIEGGELLAAIEPAPVEIGQFAKAVVKTWRRSDWRYFHHYGNGIWLERSEGEAGI